MIMILKNISEEEFSNFYENFEQKCFWQSVSMAHFESSHGWSIHYLGFYDEDVIRAATVLISKKVMGKYALFEALRGFLIDYDDLDLMDAFLNELKIYLHAHNCLYMKIDPYCEYQPHDKDGNAIEGYRRDDLIDLFEKHGFIHQGFRNGSDNNYEPRWMSILPLEGKDEEDILKKCDSKTRQNIVNTQKTGLKIDHLNKSELYRLHDMVSTTGKRRHFLNPELSYYTDFMTSFHENMQAYCVYLDTKDYYERYKKNYEELIKEKEHIYKLIEETDSKKNRSKLKNCENKITAALKRIDEAKKLREEYGDKIDLAAAMYVITDREIVYLFSGSNDTFKHFKAAYALQWYMIKYGIEHHIKRYNFYGISGIFSPEDEEYGVYLFKKGFDADVIELIGNFEYIDRKRTYTVYEDLRRIKHLVRE